jgi:hypothetical protein
MIHTEPSWKSYLVETTEPIFTPEQCDIISKLGRSMPPQNAQVGGGSGGKYDTKTRISHILAGFHLIILMPYQCIRN